MSTIKSSTTTTTAYSVEADTTGALVLQTGATPTTAVTVSSAQVVTLANALPVASGGTGATSNAAAPFALKGANSDITSLGGLTTALSLAQGGTAATSASAARTSLGLVIGTDVLSPSGSGASLTSLNATNISSGTLASARLPSGTVLQKVSTYLTSSTQLTSSGAFHELTSSLRVSITPKSSTSILYLRAYGSYVSPANNGLMYGAFYDVTNSAYVNLPPAVGSRKQSHWFKRTTSADANDADDMNFSAQVTNTNTTARTYTIYHSTEGQTCQFLVSSLSTAGGASYPLYFEVMEIAP